MVGFGGGVGLLGVVRAGFPFCVDVVEVLVGKGVGWDVVVRSSTRGTVVHYSYQ